MLLGPLRRYSIEVGNEPMKPVLQTAIPGPKSEALLKDMNKITVSIMQHTKWFYIFIDKRCVSHFKDHNFTILKVQNTYCSFTPKGDSRYILQ